MEDAVATRIFEKLDEQTMAINGLQVEVAKQGEATKPCREMCRATHQAVYGNGGEGLKTTVATIQGDIRTLKKTKNGGKSSKLVAGSAMTGGGGVLLMIIYWLIQVIAK